MIWESLAETTDSRAFRQIYALPDQSEHLLGAKPGVKSDSKGNAKVFLQLCIKLFIISILYESRSHVSDVLIIAGHWNRPDGNVWPFYLVCQA